jgi:ComF family protein
MNLKSGYLSDFVSLLFPELCAACHESLLNNENLICTDCLYNLPYTNFHLKADNIVAQQFWGKIPLENAYSLFYFSKGGKVQNLMHQFKYKGMHQIGPLLGEIAGNQLIKNESFSSVDFIVPVPLHKKRRRERGYNQSERFADGLSQKLSAPVVIDNLVREIATETQTHKSRFARFENMQEVFMVRDHQQFINKHILLVDDTVTTGATLEACGIQLLKIEGVKLSIATIAYAE